jgi:hypothetical protein
LGTGCPQCRDSGNLDELIEMAFSHFGTKNELTCKTTAEKINLFRLMWTLVLVQPSTIEDLD